MSESNKAVFYTTAQVTEMVDLSDQNVRKYVRLLEDRDYNVAKDEHNRRLFSSNDVVVLKELIVQAKQPAYTLETAADEVVGNLDSILSKNENSVQKNVNNNDVTEMFIKVMEKLEDIQEENRDLKSNINNLVHRLEEYDNQPGQNYLEYSEEDKEEDSKDDAPDDEETVDSESETEESEQSTEESSIQDQEDSNQEETADGEESSEEQGNNIDMGEYKSEEQEQEENEKKPEKKGIFGGFFDFLKG